MKIGKIIVVFILACIVSGYYFPIGFTFLPESLNTKQILAVIGLAFFGLGGIRERSFSLSRRVLVSACIAILFSVWCFFCITENGTDDDSYATYIRSYIIWLSGAFAVYSFLKLYHGRVDLKLLTDYLMGVCAAQCVLALMIDNIPAFQSLVDRYVSQGQEFFQEVNRLYGIGAALDPAGVRFTVALLLIAHQIGTNRAVSEDRRSLYMYIAFFIVISVVGNMIARTTSLGMALGLLYMFVSIGLGRLGTLTRRQARFYNAIAVLGVVSAVVGIYLYRTNYDFRENIRFAFEAFFNYVEQGEFRTDSTDKLSRTMWIWPKTSRAWLIGTGIFGNYVYSTDIGYCRFVLYCGVVGMVIFSIFFVYDAFSIVGKFEGVRLLSLLLLASTFVIWLKVATDIFFIYALLFCIDGDDDEEDVDAELQESTP